MRVFIEHIKLYDHAEAWPKKKSNLPSIAKKNFLKGVFSSFRGLNERFKRLFLKGKKLKGKIGILVLKLKGKNKFQC